MTRTKDIEELEELYLVKLNENNGKLSDTEMHDIFKKEFDLGINYEDMDYILVELDIEVLKYTVKYYNEKFTAKLFYDCIIPNANNFEYLLDALIEKIDLEKAYTISLNPEINEYSMECILNHPKFDWKKIDCQDLFNEFCEKAMKNSDSYVFRSTLTKGQSLIKILQKHWEN